MGVPCVPWPTGAGGACVGVPCVPWPTGEGGACVGVPCVPWPTGEGGACVARSAWIRLPCISVALGGLPGVFGSKLMTDTNGVFSCRLVFVTVETDQRTHRFVNRKFSFL